MAVSLSSLCDKCQQLDFSEFLRQLLSRLERCDLTGIKQKYVNLIVQRTIFHFELPLVSQCPSCKVIRQGLENGGIIVRDDGRLSSLLKLQFNHEVTVYTPQQDFDRFSEVIDPRSGDFMYETDILKPSSRYLTSSELLPSVCTRTVMFNNVDYQHLRGLLNVCTQEHELCRPTEAPELQIINLINVESRELVRYPTEQGCDYVALSYV